MSLYVQQCSHTHIYETLDKLKIHGMFPAGQKRRHWQPLGRCLKHRPSQLRTQRGPNRSQQKQSTYICVALGSLSASAGAIYLHGVCSRLCRQHTISACIFVALGLNRPQRKQSTYIAVSLGRSMHRKYHESKRMLNEIVRAMLNPGFHRHEGFCYVATLVAGLMARPMQGSARC